MRRRPSSKRPRDFVRKMLEVNPYCSNLEVEVELRVRVDYSLNNLFNLCRMRRCLLRLREVRRGKEEKVA